MINDIDKKVKDGNLRESNENLWKDYIDLCSKYDGKMEIYEFGFSILRFASKMLMDSSPTYSVGHSTIMEGINAGMRWHSEESKHE